MKFVWQGGLGSTRLWALDCTSAFDLTPTVEGEQSALQAVHDCCLSQQQEELHNVKAHVLAQTVTQPLSQPSPQPLHANPVPLQQQPYPNPDRSLLPYITCFGRRALGPPLMCSQAATNASRTGTWSGVSVGAALAVLRSWLEENSLEDYDLSAW